MNWLLFSGGKDSIAIKHMLEKEGIEFKAVFFKTGLEPKELIDFAIANNVEIREYPKLKDICKKYKTFPKYSKDRETTLSIMNEMYSIWWAIGEEGDTIYTGMNMKNTPEEQEINGRKVKNIIYNKTPAEMIQYCVENNLKYPFYPSQNIYCLPHRRKMTEEEYEKMKKDYPYIYDEFINITKAINKFYGEKELKEWLFSD